jgi:HSP20 family protein
VLNFGSEKVEILIKTRRKEVFAMAIIRWFERASMPRSHEVMGQLKKEMDRLFADFSGRPASPYRTGVFPHINASEDDQNLYVRSELPGIEPHEIEISVEGDTLTLRGERKLPEAGEGVNYHRREREAGRFRRVVTLPAKINPNGVEAIFKNGVLKIVLPKAAEARAIQVKVKTE